jgi:hypothetical protein
VAGGGDPDQDSGQGLEQGPAHGGLEPVVASAQSRKVAGAGGAAQMVGAGVVVVAPAGRAAACGIPAGAISAVDQATHPHRRSIAIVAVDLVARRVGAEGAHR